MKDKIRNLWKYTKTSAGKIFTLDNVKSTADSGKAVFQLAKILDEKKDDVQNLAPVVNKISTLFDVLNTPWGQIIGASVPFVSIGVNLLQFYLDITKTDPPLTQTVALITQSAYLSSLNNYLNTNRKLAEQLKNSDKKFSEQIIDNEIGSLINELAKLEIDDKEATFTLAFFADSKLAKAFNLILHERLFHSSIEPSRANDITQQIARDANRFITHSLMAGTEKYNKIKQWYQLGGQEKFEWRYSLETYLHDEIKPLPTKQVFDEAFTFQDIYVPLKAVPLDANGQRSFFYAPFVLENWVNEEIRNDKCKDQVLVIQAGAGRGKSVFCRMFAEQVWRELHPALTPIFIRLRDIDTFKSNFEETINTFLSNRDFVKSDSTWLTDRNTRYLFILDGFDELRLEGRSKVGLERFLQQIATFQKQFATSETGHRVIITGRTIAFQGINLPSNMIQVQLLTMDQQLQEVWLSKWQKVLYNNTEYYPDKTPQDAEEEIIKFTEFLFDAKCPEEVQDELAVEPLLLYLLAAMHRDGEIKLADFGDGTAIQSKITIYEQSFNWVLTKQRDKELQRQITGLSPDEFEEVMEIMLMESALAVVQSGGESANLSMINNRLPKDLACNWKQLQENEKTLSTALGVFYIKKDQDGGVEFYHKSFSEFLFAKRIYHSLREWTNKIKQGRRDKWIISDDELPKHIYDLFGYGGLSVEIVEYLRGLITKDDDFPYVDLFDRLQNFYFAWCDGEYIDAKGITHPQSKMQELEPYIADDNKLGQRQVDVYTGYNVMILLFELHRHGKKSDDEKLKQALYFHPCGEMDEDSDPKQEDLLLRLIGYGYCVGTNAFSQMVCPFLYGVYLRSANLNGTYLNSANLRSANLYRAKLYGANLEGANLEGANLENSNLRSANLESTNLYGANLRSANLQSIQWDDETNWNNVKSIETAKNIPKRLKRQLGLN